MRCRRNHRLTYMDPTPRDLFYMLTGESEQTLHNRSLVYARVMKEAHSGKGFVCTLESTSNVSAFINNDEVSCA